MVDKRGIKDLLARIFGNRYFQMTFSLFIAGFLLALFALYPVLKTDTRRDTLGPEDDGKFVDIRHPSGAIKTIFGVRPALKNATLKIKSKDADTNATVFILDYNHNRTFSTDLKGEDKKTLNLTEMDGVEFIEFEIEDGKLSFMYTVKYYSLSHAWVTLVAAPLMLLSLPFLFLFISQMRGQKASDEEMEKIKADQKVVDDILSEKK